MHLEILNCLGYDPQSLNVHGFDPRAKIFFFFLPIGTAIK